ncbi:MAG: hypothetical protein AAF569_08395 [Pseudomonadota bacterium]
MSQKHEKRWYEGVLDIMDEILVAIGFVICLPFFIGFGIPAYLSLTQGGGAGLDSEIFATALIFLHPFFAFFLLGLFLFIGIPILRLFRVSITALIRKKRNKDKEENGSG